MRVLDFVSDVRRLAAAMDLNRQASSVANEPQDGGPVIYPAGQIVKFEGDEHLDFFMRYIEDVAELEDSDESARLKVSRSARAAGHLAMAEPRDWNPCIVDPVRFDCRDCTVGPDVDCKYRTDETLRHERAARLGGRGGAVRGRGGARRGGL